MEMSTLATPKRRSNSLPKFSSKNDAFGTIERCLTLFPRRRFATLKRHLETTLLASSRSVGFRHRFDANPTVCDLLRGRDSETGVRASGPGRDMILVKNVRLYLASKD